MTARMKIDHCALEVRADSEDASPTIDIDFSTTDIRSEVLYMEIIVF